MEQQTNNQEIVQVELTPELSSVINVFRRAQQDKIFAAKLNTCENSHDVYRIAKENVLCDEASFCDCFEKFNARLEEAEAAGELDAGELTDEELAMVVGGVPAWMSAIGKFFVRHGKTIASGVIGTVSSVISLGAPVGEALKVAGHFVNYGIDFVLDSMAVFKVGPRVKKSSIM